MNEDRKKRGLAHSKFLTAVAISSLLLSSGNVMATPTVPSAVAGVTEQSQVVTVTGLVVDSTGEPIIGVNVVVKGSTNKGTITDVNGKFTLSVSPGDKLNISYIGYKTKTVEIGKQRSLTITLEEDANVLGEVEITAEFGMKRVARSVGSSVQNVKAADIIESGRDNFISALQGRVSGMNVSSSGGAPGSSTTVTLRSITSISGSNQPLYVVDGIPMNNSTFDPTAFADAGESFSSRNLDFASRGNDFNPEDIESMTVPVSYTHLTLPTTSRV